MNPIPNFESRIIAQFSPSGNIGIKILAARLCGNEKEAR